MVKFTDIKRLKKKGTKGVRSQRIPKLSPWTEDPLLPHDNAEDYLNRYDELMRNNVRSLVDYVVAVRMMEGLDCLLLSTEAECGEQSHRCRWLANHGCVAKEDARYPPNVDEKRRLQMLQRQDANKLTVGEHIQNQASFES